MRILTLEFTHLEDRNAFIKKYHKKYKYYRLFAKNGKYYMEWGADN